ncbi:MAG: hypothetical protein FJ291_07715 [Planctomycetes bacterium]|nr:hypothetical protein [Planctomycetota bacterium]
MWSDGTHRATQRAVALLCWVLLAAPCLADTLRGTLRSVDATGRRIVVTDKDGDDNPFVVAQTASISLNGKRATLGDLRRGDRVVVTFAEDPGGTATASAIEATRKPG